MLWWKFRDHGKRQWSVFLVDKLNDEETGAALWGLTDFEKRHVYILATQPHNQLADTTIHELMHVSAGVDMRSEIEHAAEENFIQRASVGLWRIMSGLGMRLPPFPEGFKPRAPKRKPRAAR